jgi:hypothetical protein
MSTATFQITLTPKRMLTETEAARHCGLLPKRFKLECPVQPIRYSNGDIRYRSRSGCMAGQPQGRRRQR